jgi:hypothetical protein
MTSTRCPLSAAVLNDARNYIIEAHTTGNAPLLLVLTLRDAGTTQQARRVNATVSRARRGVRPTLVLSMEVLTRHVDGSVVETVFPCEAYDVFRVAMTTAATDKHKATVLQWPSVKARRYADEEAEGEERPLRRHRVESTVSDALDVVMKLALAKAERDATSRDLGQPVMNPCLRTGAVYRQFLAALGDAPLLNPDGTLAKDVLLVYHGTPSVENAERIMCEGFDPATRSRQSYGRGEYFADTLRTPLQFAGGTGAVMLCAVFIRPAVVSRKWECVNKEYYTIVETPEDRTAAYALPLVVLPLRSVTLGNQCGQCTHRATFNQHVKFRNDGGRWQRMSAQDSQAVSTSRPGQPVAMNGFEYVYDLTAMTQTNTKTSKVRSIRFVSA